MKSTADRLRRLESRIAELEARREETEKFPRAICLLGVAPGGEIATFSALVIGGDPIQPEPGESLEKFKARLVDAVRELPPLAA